MPAAARINRPLNLNLNMKALTLLSRETKRELMDLALSLVGLHIQKVRNTDQDVIFDTNVGEVLWVVDADCCSHTWIENLDVPLGLVMHVGDRDLSGQDFSSVGGAVYTQVYGIELRTLQGSGLIEFRNESNGYYGGSMRVGGWADSFPYSYPGSGTRSYVSLYHMLPPKARKDICAFIPTLRRLHAHFGSAWTAHLKRIPSCPDDAEVWADHLMES